ncbi:MAG: GIY-YIG nuclease family protein, partial [Gammaproteobacteria bacterium]|nr:GIY-YIG nuclease family protein [Gammaproteobacteria bacterium]
MTAFDPKTFLSSITQRAGVYVMSGVDGSVLYIGKAKNLKSRLSSYFVTSGLSTKTRALVKRIADIKVTVVGTEIEALLLEQNLIKEHRPPYNVL